MAKGSRGRSGKLSAESLAEAPELDDAAELILGDVLDALHAYRRP